MNIEIISIGDELLIGQTVNTNASWMGDQLLNIGIQVKWVTTIGDDRSHLIDALKTAESRADSILVTGGLGPTHDDITKMVMTEYFNDELILSEKLLEQVKERFRIRNVPMVKVNEEQALVPKSAEIIENKLGTAAGMVFTRNEKRFYVLPGVPREMKGMMHSYILDDIRKRTSGSFKVRKTLATTGIPESTLFEKIGNVDEIENLAKIAFLPNLSGVKIRMISEAETESKAMELLQQAEIMLRKNIEAFIYAEDDMPLEDALAQLLIEKKQTLAIAESCTGGLIANKFTNLSGSSAFLLGGVVSYSNQAKMDILGVPPELIEMHGAVSAEVAQAMAKGARERFGADYAVSTTGIAGPTGGTDEKPVGLVYVGYADANGTNFKKRTFFNDRLGNKERFSQVALDLLRKKILGMEP